MSKEKDVGKKHPGGRPPMFKTVAEMQAKIDDYFKWCEGEIVTDKKGEPIRNKFGDLVIMGSHHPTVIGLAYHLGFTSRQALLNYQDKQEFVDSITRAKLKIEAYANEMLFDKGACNGAKFTLINNFKGYHDKQEVEHSGEIGMPAIKITK